MNFPGDEKRKLDGILPEKHAILRVKKFKKPLFVENFRGGEIDFRGGGVLPPALRKKTLLYVSKSYCVVIWHVFSRGQWHLCCWGECTHRHLMNFGPNSLRNCNSKWRIICCIVFVNQTLQFERKCVNAPPNLLAACWVSNFYRRSIQCLNAIVFGKIPLSQIVRTFHTPLILFCRTFNVSVEL